MFPFNQTRGRKRSRGVGPFGKSILAALLAVMTGISSLPALAAREPESDQTIERTPPRLSLIEGEASFWRPGAEDWAQARLNTALAPGDALYTGASSRLELQIGARSFARLSGETQIGLENQEPDFVQLKITTGSVVLDLRELARGHAIELDTSNAAVTIDDPGYYRADATENGTTLVTRRGGRARVTLAGGETAEVAPNDQVVIEGTDAPRLAVYNAPALDDWDRWNDDRSDHLLASRSSRYLSPDISGADTLDDYGSWRTVPTYGQVWVPSDVPPTWAPYSTGQWVWDPSYDWTWVDDAPWGWAPYHYGRWVHLDSYWAWAPGPILATPVYAPALVAFFGGHGFHASIGLPFVSWVALGWGEPLIPWWGHAGFIGVPCWAGWGGPRIVNNVFVNNTTIVNVFHNTRVPHGIITVRGDEFGRGAIARARLAGFDARRLQPLRGALPFRPRAQSLAPVGNRGIGRALRPPDGVLGRQVVATRPAHDPTSRLTAAGLAARSARIAPAARLVAPQLPRGDATAQRAQTLHLNPADRQVASVPPRLNEPQKREAVLSGRGQSRWGAPPPPPAHQQREGRRAAPLTDTRRPSVASVPPPPPRAQLPERSMRAPHSPPVTDARRGSAWSAPPVPQSGPMIRSAPYGALRQVERDRPQLPPRFEGGVRPMPRAEASLPAPRVVPAPRAERRVVERAAPAAPRMAAPQVQRPSVAPHGGGRGGGRSDNRRGS